MPSKAMPIAWLVITGVLVLMVAGFVIALAVGWLNAG
jgi:hypothetical protein